MSLLFLRGGILTTLQDLGRIGFRRFGINPNGAMDTRAARLLNILLGDAENTAILETHFPAARILFESDALTALGGADFAAEIDGQPLENWRVGTVKANSVLTFTRRKFGERAYLAIRSGFRVEQWLKSRSTNLRAEAGGFQGRALQRGDRLLLNSSSKVETAVKSAYKITTAVTDYYRRSPNLRVIVGAEWQQLTLDSQQNFCRNSFSIRSQSDRMGYRLSGEPLSLNRKTELVSSAVNFGTVQLLPDGNLIILMADHQTIGGYARIAHVINCDLPTLAQTSAGDTVTFEVVSLETAENLLLAFEKQLDWLRAGCRFKNEANNG